MAGAEVNPAITAGMQRAVQVIAEAGAMPADMARDYLEGLGISALYYMRAAFGDDYVRGWLESAMADLDRPPVLISPIRNMHGGH
ncbi:hypothetical protein [Pseudoxanthomonas sp. PXM04]|uniref:hypothetical protein n=1 Tax=Pseudoxanthomonas sp. PXM04 TaxID=2769297 RepID=UPI00177C2988|nr:hypothetical protein [Pseudoxanthomonas sp. PXM04]MBD9376165.1 hypothetical protein [Pseudoxanthomonas sp. PXM04]